MQDTPTNVVLKQRLSEKEYRDDGTKNTLRVFATSTETVGKAGIERALVIEIENDARLDNGDQQRIVKTLPNTAPKQIDSASIEVLRAIEKYRPGFHRPITELSANAVDGITVGALKKEGKDWISFVELSANDRRLRCSVGDLEQLHEFRSFLTEAGNF